VLAPNKVELLVDGQSIPHSEFSLMISSTLGRLFAGMRPFWGLGSGPVRFTGFATGSQRFGRAAPGILRGRPRSWVTPETGYTSCNAKRIDIRLDCAFTVDGELVDPMPSRILTLTADDRLRFIRA
jgi:hypothetical protein